MGTAGDTTAHPDPTARPAAAQVASLIAAHDAAGVGRLLRGTDDPIDCLAALHESLRNAYWKNHDVAAVCVIARGVQPLTAELLRRQPLCIDILAAAKPVLYDVGSFLWPGWDEPGIALTPDHLALGRACAALNLEVAKALRRDRIAMARAWWLVGAFHLATFDCTAARIAFEEAARLSRGSEAMLQRGYISLCHLLAGAEADPAVESTWHTILAALATMPEGPAFVAQLETAHRALKDK